MRIRLEDIIPAKTIIPVVVIDRHEDAIPLASCLLDAGIPTIEVTLRTNVAMEAIKLICKNVPGIVVGVGSIWQISQLEAAISAGAHFGVSPGSHPQLLAAVKSQDWPFLFGSATPSEVMNLASQGFDRQKLFPSEPIGGVSFIKALQGPLPQVTFCPTGGVSLQNLAEYKACDNVFAVGGSWIAPRQLVANHDWQEISYRAKQALGTLQV